jgi:exodeoxyribonuclease VII large subunit
MSRRLDELEVRIGRAARRRAADARQRLAATAARLDSLSPLAVLARGYSVTLRASDGAVLRSADEVEVGQSIETRLHDGGLVSRVLERIVPPGDSGEN